MTKLAYYYYVTDGEVRCVETSYKKEMEKVLGAVLYENKEEAEKIKETQKKNRIINIREELIAVYEDWVNNFITIPAFADYYGLSEKDAKEVVDLGKKLYNKKNNF